MTVHVLVVEDNDSLREWLTRVLHNAGYTVTQAMSGEDALTLLQQTGAYRVPFDVVISDIVMGAVNGIDVIHAARSQLQPPEVILMTSHGNLDTAITAVRLGAFDYMQKPVQPPLLLARVAVAAERRADRLQQTREAAAWRAVADVVNRVQPSAPADLTETKPERYRTVGRLKIDTQRREIWFDGELVAVTPIEYTILAALSERPAVVVTYSALAQRTHAAMLSEREAYGLLRTHMRNLRRKIERGYLISVRGVGYMLDASGQAAGDEE